MADLNDIQTNLDIALFDRDPVARDRAQLILSERVDKLWLGRAIDALDAPRDLTRRRALRLLSSCPPARTHKRFKARILDQTVATRIRVSLARILTATSDGIVTELATTIKATDVRLRRASATATHPTDALLNALFDEDEDVVSRAAEALLKREHPIPPEQFKPSSQMSAKSQTCLFDWLRSHSHRQKSWNASVYADAMRSRRM